MSTQFLRINALAISALGINAVAGGGKTLAIMCLIPIEPMLNMKKFYTYSRSPALDGVLALLVENQLITDDINAEKLQHFVGVFDHEQLIGVGGIEYLGEHSLLRSLAVKSEFQGLGIARELMGRIEHYSLSLGVAQLYLLTHTAEQLFLATGYRLLKRSDAPEEIARSNQFDSLCPADSAFMVKSLAEGSSP